MRRLAMLAVVLVSLPCAAGPNRWTTSGPGVGVMSRLYVDPTNANTAFASTSAGVYKTSDGGQEWRAANEGLPTAPISAFLVSSDGTLYASVGGKIFASTDGGDHWLLRVSPGRVYVSSLAFDPASSTLIAATNGGVGIYISGDRGQTWKSASIPDAIAGSLVRVDYVVVSATAAYAATIIQNSSSYTLLRSTDGGQTWELIQTTIEPRDVYADPASDWVYALAKSPVVSFVVSKDHARTWTALPPLSKGITKLIPVGTIAFAATDAGVFIYDDSAQSWQAVGSSASTEVHDLAVSLSTPRHFYAAPPSGIITFVEGDTDWAAKNAGLPGAVTSDVDLARVLPSTAYTTTEGGVFRTDDGGQSWTSLSQSLGPLAPPSERVFPLATLVAVSPEKIDTAYVLGGSGDSTGVLKTLDRGATWKTVTPNFGLQLAIAPSDPKTLYAALSSGMAKSTDAGESWNSIMSDLPRDYLDFYYGFWASSIAVDPSNASNVTVAKFSGVFKTTNGGGNWRQLSSEPSMRGLTIVPSDPSTLFAAKSTAGVIRSNDGGVSWNAAGLSDRQVLTVAMSNGILYAGTDNGHVYRSDDGGESWIGFDDGLIRGRVARVVVDPGGKHLYAATGGGVYQYEILNQDISAARVADDPLRLPHMLDVILSGVPADAALFVPIVGTVRGIGGTLFTTQLTLSNARATPQDVLITWLPRGADDGVASFRMTIPGTDDASGGTIKSLDLAKTFGVNGIGSLLIVAVDASGSVDANAAIDASTRIWSLPADGRAPVSQSIPPARPSLLSAHARARTAKLQNDGQFRTNAGIVNLTREPHQFTVQINGERASGQFTVEVQPFTLLQVPLPEDNYGMLALDVYPDTSNIRWVSYGSTIDRATGEGRTSLGTPLE